MGTAGIDIFANLALISMLLIGSGSSGLQLKAGRTILPERAQIKLLVTPDSIFVADTGPVPIEELASRIAALGDQPSILVRVEPAVSIEREHAVLGAVMTGGAVSVSLGLSSEGRDP
jgi:hypothetical protein